MSKIVIWAIEKMQTFAQNIVNAAYVAALQASGTV